MEVWHLVQSYPKLRTTKYKFESPEANLRRYGQVEPPEYDLGKITNRRLVIFGANEDILVSAESIAATSSQIKGELQQRKE